MLSVSEAWQLSTAKAHGRVAGEDAEIVEWSSPFAVCVMRRNVVHQGLSSRILLTALGVLAHPRVQSINHHCIAPELLVPLADLIITRVASLTLDVPFVAVEAIRH